MRERVFFACLAIVWLAALLLIAGPQKLHVGLPAFLTLGIATLALVPVSALTVLNDDRSDAQRPLQWRLETLFMAIAAVSVFLAIVRANYLAVIEEFPVNAIWALNRFASVWLVILCVTAAVALVRRIRLICALFCVGALLAYWTNILSQFGQL